MALASVALGMGTASLVSPLVDPTANVIMHGWMLKKRRKKLQGFARRYFMLYQSGLLVYSFGPGQPIRDRMSLSQAAISTAVGRRDIHIDSNTGTFHVKCLTSEEFQDWMFAFRKFISTGQEVRRSMALSLRQVTRQGSISLNKSSTIAEEMGSSLADLETSVNSLKAEVSSTKDSRKSSTKGEKEPRKSSSFGLFRKSHHPPTPPSLEIEVTSEPEPPRISLKDIESALEALKSQHSRLLQALHELSLAESSQSRSNSLPLTKEEDEYTEEPHEQSPLSPGRDHRPVYSPAFSSRHSKRGSVATSIADSVNEWFDAWDGDEPGAQEFVLEPDTSQDDQKLSMILHESQDSVVDDDRSSIDTDIDDGEETATIAPMSPVPPTPATPLPPLVRRTILPAPITGDEGSIFTVLKKNVGKDLSTIALPVTFNEPLTMLQRAAEEVEYYELLTKAAESTDSVERLAFIAAFAISGYAHTRYRSSRKGFNPMLAETFEDDRMHFIAEKVKHNPVEMAYHADGPGWELTATSAGKTKFWGKSLEIIPLGSTHLQIGEDHFQWKKPSSFMRGLMMGTKYLEHCGDMTIMNTKDGSNCICEFKQSSYWGAGANAVSGTIYHPPGNVAAKIEGKWDEQISLTVDEANFRILWRASPPPKGHEDYYGFTTFGMSLNEIVGDMKTKLPPTDSRWRADVRALEEGRLDDAEAQKVRIEELQRERRRQGADAQPRWFQKVGDNYEYLGGYWEARRNGWDGLPSLW
ncbi:oxysterol binding protein [Flagelloscypha sp. PMI_526]|nr:oxysterol binding protein [Flagelloscypha sp. PMI_526]